MIALPKGWPLGLAQRVFVATMMIWLAILGWQMRHLAPTERSPEPNSDAACLAGSNGERDPWASEQPKGPSRAIANDEEAREASSIQTRGAENRGPRAPLWERKQRLSLLKGEVESRHGTRAIARLTRPVAPEPTVGSPTGALYRW